MVVQCSYQRNWNYSLKQDIENLNIEEYQLSGLEGDEMSTNNECYIGRSLDKVVFYAWVNYQRIYDDKITDEELTSLHDLYNRYA